MPYVSGLKIIKSEISEYRTSKDNVSELEEEILAQPVEKDPFFTVRFFLSAMFATIMEDSITQLRILDECNNTSRVMKAMYDMHLLLNQKYGVEGREVHELDNLDRNKLECNEYKLYKLEKDRLNVQQVLTAVYFDLAKSHQFRALWDWVRGVEQDEEYKESLIQEAAQNKVLRWNLYKQLRQQRNHCKTVAYEADHVRELLKKTIEDADHTTAIKERYVEKWQHSRVEQHDLNLKSDEQQFSTNIGYYKVKTDHESLVHSEIEMLINIAINESLQQIEEWMEKYEKDMEKIDLSIQIMNSDYQKELEKRKNLESTIRKHEKEMTEWKNFKIERAAANKYKEDMTRSAIIVQAWWRGLLVRKQIGPYRPKKRGGKKKK